MNQARIAAVAAIAIPIAALFGLALVTDRSFAMRDAAHFYFPLFEWCCREWAAGRVPLWNPYENCGVPVLADTTSSLFYPGKPVFLLPLDFALRYKLYIVGHVVLAAAGSYVLARAWKASANAAAIAAISYSCGGNVVFQYCNVVFLVGAAWLPLAALAADAMLRERSWRAAMLLGLVLALMILGGDPQAAYHALLITGLYAIVLTFTKPEEAPSPAAEPAALRISRAARAIQLVIRLGLTGVAAVIGFLLAAVQVLPSSEATKYSERAAYERPRNIYEAAAFALSPNESTQPVKESRSQTIAHGLLGIPDKGSHHDLAFDFSVGPWRLAEYVWPNVSGRMFPTNRRWLSQWNAEQRTWTPTLYCGLLPAVLAIAGLRPRCGKARERWLTWLVILFTLASFGRYGFGWLAREIYGSLLRGDVSRLTIGSPVGGLYWLMVTLLPTYIYFRYPAKLLPLVSLGLSQLAAGSWDRAFAQPRPKLARALQVLGLASAAAAFVVWCLSPAMFGNRFRGDVAWGPFDAAGAYRDVLFALLQTAGVALAALWLLQKAWLGPAKNWQWQTAALLLCAIELAAANAWLVVTAPGAIWRSEPPVVAAIGRARAENMPDSAQLPPRVLRGGVRGILATWRPTEFATTSSPERLAEMAAWEHDSLFPKYHLPSGISLVESYGSIKLMDYESLIFVAKQQGTAQPNNSVLPHADALRLTGTEFLLLPADQQPKFAELLTSYGSPHVPSSGTIPRSESPLAENATAVASLWKMKSMLSRAWIVHDVEALPPLPFPLRVSAVDERTKAVLFPGNKARDFAHSAIVETEHPLAEWSEKQSDAAVENKESCRITHYDPQRVVIETHLARPGLLVLSEAWFPGWKAIVTAEGTSRESPIYRTDRVLRGVWLSAGEQAVEFQFQPASFTRGAAISGVSWLIFAVAGLIVIAKRRSTMLAQPADDS